MKKILMAVLTFALLSGSAGAQQLGGLFIGINNIGGAATAYDIKPQGISTGFLLPVNIKSRLCLNYKFKACFHQADVYSWDYWRTLPNFLSVSNEFLLGYPVAATTKLIGIPQIGLGAIGEAVYADYDVGYTHGEYFLDLALTSVYNVGFCQLGALVNYEIDLLPKIDSMLADRRFGISFLVMK